MGLDPQRTPLVAVAAAAFLVVLKGAGAWATGSLALGSAALDSAVDLFVSAANFLVLRRSAKPPDEDHAYGHGKFENLSALGQGLFLVGAAGGLVWTGVRRLIEGGAPGETGWGIAVLAVSLAVGFGVARTLEWAAQRSGSPALKADSLHYATDLWVNGAALLALVVVRFTGWSAADPLVALVVAAFVFKSGASVVLEAVGDLSDRGLPRRTSAGSRTWWPPSFPRSWACTTSAPAAAAASASSSSTWRSPGPPPSRTPTTSP